MTVPVLQPLGRAFLSGLETIGRLTLFTARAVFYAVQPPYYGRLLLRQMVEIGYYSLPVVGLTAIFTGMVLALQSYTGFTRFNAEAAIPNVVVLSMTRELGPVLAGLMVAGRIGAAIAAEIGTKRVNDKIDALTTISNKPMTYIVLVMAEVFVFIVTLMGCYHGYHSKGGAQGVGMATTNAVVSASILILIFNYIITELFFSR